MIKQFEQQLETLITGQALIEFAISFFGVGKIAEPLYRFVHLREYMKNGQLSERFRPRVT
jgi:hypothetical protein